MKNSILILDNVISDKALLDWVANANIPTGTFIKKNDVLERTGFYEQDMLRQVIGQIWFNAAFELIAPMEDDLVGFEIWSNSLPDDFSLANLAGGRGGLNYHVDKDENASKRSNGEVLHHSLYGATLYASPDDSEMIGGNLYVDTSGLENYRKYYKGDNVIDLNTGSWVKVPFKKNRLVVFDGSYPHFVEPILDIKTGKKRVGIQVNPWDRELEKKSNEV